MFASNYVRNLSLNEVNNLTAALILKVIPNLAAIDVRTACLTLVDTWVSKYGYLLPRIA